ncbi:phosphotransferase [Actinoplanes sp. NPDC048988]|uniref:phosphotransferase n=1 Tax=Actinoplanes sp. NPDC048988 TaxID=3363901 RepID=UPI003717F3C8
MLPPELLGETIVQSHTVAEWPLSRTEKVVLADGRSFAYKTTSPPVMEPEFYAAAGATRLLPAHHRVGNALLVDWIDSPSLADLPLSENELLTHAARVVQQIGELEPGLPVYLDVGTSAKWAAEAASTVVKLRQLMADGRFPFSPGVDDIESWILSAPVLGTVEAHSRLVHRDLKPAHVFPAGDGYRVIDWQFPAIAPAGVDLVGFLDEAGIDAFHHVDPVTYGIAYFLHLRWAVVAQHDLFPGAPVPFLRDWAAGGLRGVRRAAEAVI